MKSIGAALLAGLLASCAGTPSETHSPAAPRANESKPEPAPPAAGSGDRGALAAPEMAELMLAAIRVEISESVAPGQLALRAPRFRGAELGELTKRALVESRDDAGVIRVRTPAVYVPSAEPVRPEFHECSFVIDCGEPIFQDLLGQASPNGAKAPPGDLVRFVARYIDKKHSARGFDIASVVARRREGDCTEHAVLLASLFRLSGVPSQVVTGLALFTVGGQPKAFGHAWTEYHDGERWVLADASNPPEIVRRMRYVPITALSAEGPDYARRSLEGFHLIHLEGIAVPRGFSAELE